MTRGEKANQYHNSGFNCAQGVFTACCDLTGLDEKTALSIAASFGGGMRCGSVCGAVTGALMVLGMLHPYVDSSDAEARDKIAALTVEFEKTFAEKCGNLNCIDLLGMPVAEAKAQGVNAKICPVLINTACEMTEELVKREGK